MTAPMLPFPLTSRQKFDKKKDKVLKINTLSFKKVREMRLGSVQCLSAQQVPAVAYYIDIKFITLAKNLQTISSFCKIFHLSCPKYIDLRQKTDA